ncbi:hypothetical protein [Synechococcus sp. UW179A]|uniref:hypothetical protein n=1 Tax=Synechococcus sp. UW179A TaxID=2575510 RepID=UPI000E0F6BEE|nr:hypothetical protein [Synechococcus sp. UW179A]
MDLPIEDTSRKQDKQSCKLITDGCKFGINERIKVMQKLESSRKAFTHILNKIWNNTKRPEAYSSKGNNYGANAQRNMIDKWLLSRTRRSLVMKRHLEFMSN